MDPNHCFHPPAHRCVCHAGGTHATHDMSCRIRMTILFNGSMLMSVQFKLTWTLMDSIGCAWIHFDPFLCFEVLWGIKNDPDGRRSVSSLVFVGPTLWGWRHYTEVRLGPVWYHCNAGGGPGPWSPGDILPNALTRHHTLTWPLTHLGWGSCGMGLSCLPTFIPGSIPDNLQAGRYLTWPAPYHHDLPCFVWMTITYVYMK